MDIFRKRTLADYEAAVAESGLRKTLTVKDLAALGIGSVVGTGVFVATGQGAILAGPGIVLAFIIGGIVSALCALTYAELATMFPVSGTAYAYTYVAFGEFFAWFIGWDLILCYLVAGAAVASGWSGTLTGMLALYGVHLPQQLTQSPLSGGIMDLPAIFITLALTALLYVGVSESATLNNIIVLIKMFVITLFIVLGAGHINPSNYVPFVPFGFKGVMAATAVIFFAYTGFDAVSTAAEECKDPGRDLPKGLFVCLVAIIVLYLGVALTLTGVVPIDKIDVKNAIPGALATIGITWGSSLVSIGAIIGMVSTLLVVIYGQVRIFMVMARDGLLPRKLAEVNKNHGTPGICTVVTGLVTAAMAGFFPLNELINISSIGTLFLFMVVSLAVIVLRRTMPDFERKFRCPWVPVLPLISIVGCIYIMAGFDFITWRNFGIYSLIGIVIYFMYGQQSSTLNHK